MHLKNEKIEKRIDYIIVVIISIACFLMSYGYKVLNPLNTEWCRYGEDDLMQQYLGWEAFRAADWTFPLGNMSNITYPFDVSVIYTDANAFLAILFKLFRSILPSDFQYIGLWGLLCIILTGVMTYRILAKFTENRIHRIIASGIVVMSPTIFFRMFAHAPLAGQWMILFTIDTCLEYNRNHKVKPLLAKFGIIALLSASVHPYFILINGIVVAGECLYQALSSIRQNYKVILLSLSDFCIVGIATLYLIGAFSGGAAPSSFGLGENNFNLNAFFNPQGFSKVLKDLPLYGGFQYEGFAYLGLGIILLLLYGLIHALSTGEPSLHSVATHKKEIISISCVLVVSLFISLSNVITLNEHVIMQYTMPPLLDSFLSVFRATGRVSWVMTYTITLIVIIYCCISIKDKKFVSILLCACLLLQAYDLSDAMSTKRAELSSTQNQYQYCETPNEVFSYFANNKTFKHVILVDHYYNVNLADLCDITEWAINHGKTFNTFYLARSVDHLTFEEAERRLANPADEDLFICPIESKLKIANSNLHWYNGGKFIVGGTSLVSGLNEMDEEKIYEDYELGSEIVFFSSDDYNAKKYAIDGISICEDRFSWTDGKELNIAFRTKDQTPSLCGEIELINVYHERQHVKIWAGEKNVFDDYVTLEQKIISFDFPLDQDTSVVKLKFEFPDCSSPLENGESGDARKISLAIKSMRFSKIE